MIRALGLILIVACAQSLTDAAKRAEEQRKEAEGLPRILLRTGGDNTFREVPLDKWVFERYAAVRRDLASMLRLHPALFERLIDGANHVTRFRQFSTVLENEPDIAAFLKERNYSSDYVVDVELTIRRCIGRIQRTYPDPRGAIDTANLRFCQSYLPFTWEVRSWNLNQGGQDFFPQSVPE